MMSSTTSQATASSPKFPIVGPHPPPPYYCVSDKGLQSGVSDSDVPNNDVINNDVLNPVQPQLDNVHINAIETSLTALDNISNDSVHPRQPL